MLRACRQPAVLAAAVTLTSCATPSATGDAPFVDKASPQEEILVLRSMRNERTRRSSWCSVERTGLAPAEGRTLDDRYTMWSVVIEPRDARITDPKASPVGEMRACVTPTPDPKVATFYAEARIAGIGMTGRGDCLLARADFPEKGITTYRCYLELDKLPAPYVGGLLTTNTIATKAVLGDLTDPPGYVQPSIAVVRLWRKRE